MKLETIKKDKRKKIIIGSMVVLSVFGCLTLTTTRAKYRSTQSLKLASGIVNYKASDLHIVAVKVSEDGTSYTDQPEIPTSGYTFNTEKSKCRIPTSTLTGENAPADESIPIEYKEGRVHIGVNKKNTKCYLYFDKILTTPSEETLAKLDINNIKEGTPDFTQKATGTETEDNNGIYKVTDGMYGGYSYYWRGKADTSHIIFDNKCWRIIRINGDGSIRLIYNGRPSGTTCLGNGNSEAVITGSSGTEKYYATSTGSYDSPSYVGWTYTLNTQRTLNGTDSNAKYQTELWYTNNISIAAKTKVDSNGKFCNDRNVGNTPSSFGWNSNQYVTSWSAWINDNGKWFSYSVAKRLLEDYAPTLSCPNEDIYSLSVGAITADEVIFAGGEQGNNTSYYLYTNQSYWTMSPSYWHGGNAWMFYIDMNGNLSRTGVVNATFGLRPVINLRSDVTFNIGSDGTQNNPYIVQ